MPLFSPHHAPAPPHDRNAYERPSTEPIFVSLISWQPKRSRPGTVDNGGEYLTTWYVGRIAENAVRKRYIPRMFFKNKLLMATVIGSAKRYWNAGWTKLRESFAIYWRRFGARFRRGENGPSLHMGSLLFHSHWTRETKIRDWKEGDGWFIHYSLLYAVIDVSDVSNFRSRSLWAFVLHPLIIRRLRYSMVTNPRMPILVMNTHHYYRVVCCKVV